MSEANEAKKKRKVVQRFHVSIYTYQLELINCGKSGCSKCPHGPYWYLYWMVEGRRQRRYIGKVLKLIGQTVEDSKRIMAEKLALGQIPDYGHNLGG